MKSNLRLPVVQELPDGSYLSVLIHPRKTYETARQPFLDGPASGDAEHISNEQNLQGVDKAAAGRTSISTWLPASCV